MSTKNTDAGLHPYAVLRSNTTVFVTGEKKVAAMSEARMNLTPVSSFELESLASQFVGRYPLHHRFVTSN